MTLGNYPNFFSGLAGGVMYSFCFAVLALTGSGCTGGNRQNNVSATEMDRDRVSDEVLRIDLGCIQRGGKVEFCVPLSKLRIASHAEIRSIKSSCECVVAEKITYLSGSQTDLGEGIQLSIAPTAAPNEPPVPLRVQVEMVLREKGHCLLELDFLETDFFLMKETGL